MTQTQRRSWIKALYIVATLVMVLGNFIAAVPAVITAATNESITPSATSVTAGDSVTMKVDGLTPQVTTATSMQQTVTISGSGLAFDESKFVGVNKGYGISQDKKTLTLPNNQTMPVTIAFTTTNTSTSAVTGTVTARYGALSAPVTTGDIQTANVTIKPKATTSSTTATPAATSSSIQSVTKAAVAAAATTVTGTQFYLSPQSIAPDEMYNNAYYGITGFPLFYLKDGSKYAAVWSNNEAGWNAGIDTPQNALKSIFAGGTTSTDISAAVRNKMDTRGKAGPILSDFYSSATDTAPTGYTPGQSYQMYSFNPINATGMVGFKRIRNGTMGQNYYLPNTTTLPKLQVNAAGDNISFTGVTEGKGLYGQYSNTQTTAKTLNVNMVKLKEIRVVVVDKDGNETAVPGATVNFTDMTATTGSSTDVNSNTSVGEMVPTGYNESATGSAAAFYYGKGTDGNGTQVIKSITVPGYTKSDYVTPEGKQLTLNQTTDKLESTDSQLIATATENENGNKIAGAVDTSKNNAQIVTLKLKAKASYTQAQTNLSIKKVDKSDATKTLSGAQFAVSEVGNTTDPIAATTTAKTGSDGLTVQPVSQTSATATRIIKVQEKQAPSGYVRDDTVYYAKWEAWKGFTGVGTTQSDVTATSAGNASVDSDGHLVMADSQGTTPKQADYKLQYTNAAKTGLNGAALPTMGNMTTITSADGLETYSGLSSLILPMTPTATATSAFGTSTTPASLAADGSTYNFDSSMATSTAVSANSDKNSPGVGMVQSLWSQTALPVSVSANDLYSQISSAITSGSILGPKSTGVGYLDYSIINPAMQGRAKSGTTAYDYYTFAQTMNLYKLPSNSLGNVIGGSVQQTNKAYATNAYSTNGQTFVTVLQKVKKVVFTSSDSTAKYTALFKSTNLDGSTSYMVSNASGELVPSDSSGAPKTSGFFAWPSGDLNLVSITDQNGNDVTPSDKGGAISLNTSTDKLSMANSTADASIDANNNIAYNLAPTTHKILAASLTPTATDITTPLNNAAITLTGDKGSQTFKTATDGSVIVSDADIRKLVSGTTTNGTKVTLKINADGSQAQSGKGTFGYNNILTHEISYTFGTGFAVDTKASANGIGAPAVYDGQVVDSNTQDGAFQPLPLAKQLSQGDIGVWMRRDVLRVQSLADQSTPVGATFAIKYYKGDADLAKDDPLGSTTITTSGNGVNADAGTLLLPDPAEVSAAVAGYLTPINSVKVTITQTSVDGDYQLNSTPISMVYTSLSGYTSPNTAGDQTQDYTDFVTYAPVSQQINATARNWTATSGSSILQSVNTFYPMASSGVTGGTQVIYNQQPSSVTITSGAQNLNFGKVELSPSAQSVDALPSTAAADELAGTTPTTANFGVTVAQKGPLSAGWYVTMTADKFSPADASLDTASIHLNQGSLAYSGGATATGMTVNPAVALNLVDSDTVMRANGQNAAGSYQLSWAPGNIQLNLPAFAGSVGETNASALTFNLISGDTTDSN